MAERGKNDEEVLQALAAAGSPLRSAEERATLHRIRTRLAAAERVCELVRAGLARGRRRDEKGKKVHWWDVAIALQEWEKALEPQERAEKDQPSLPPRAPL